MNSDESKYLNMRLAHVTPTPFRKATWQDSHITESPTPVQTTRSQHIPEPADGMIQTKQNGWGYIVQM